MISKQFTCRFVQKVNTVSVLPAVIGDQCSSQFKRSGPSAGAARDRFIWNRKRLRDQRYQIMFSRLTLVSFDRFLQNS
jgi:hypothetical protein